MGLEVLRGEAGAGLVARAVVLGRALPLVLIFHQQVFDGVVGVEGIHGADLIGEFLCALGALALTLGSGLLGLLGGEAALLDAALDFLRDGVVGIQPHG